MIKYNNFSGESGILAYESTGDSLTIRFRGNGIYLYNYHKPGMRHVEEMKRLAAAGQGLATYINKYIRDSYAEKIL